MIIPEKLYNIIEENNFTIFDDGDGIYTFQRYSPADQDFNFTIQTEDNIDYFLNNILSYYENFDVSYETYLWLDEDGHGKNGAPYDMKDVYEDMEVCHGYIMELYNIVAGYRNGDYR